MRPVNPASSGSNVAELDPRHPQIVAAAVRPEGERPEFVQRKAPAEEQIRLTYAMSLPDSDLNYTSCHDARCCDSRLVELGSRPLPPNLYGSEVYRAGSRSALPPRVSVIFESGGLIP